MPAIGVKKQGVGAIQLGQVCAVDKRDGHPGAIGGGGPQALCGIAAGVEAAQHRLHLLHSPAAVGVGWGKPVAD